MMKMQFEFSTASRIVFGRGKLSEIKNILKHMGSRVLLITGKSSNRTDILTSLLDKNHIPYARFSIKREPNIADINEGISHVRQIGCEFVVAIGGGSVIDAGKAIACLSRNEGNVIDYLEVIGRGKQIPQAGLGMAAIPTTAGTGSEVTRNSVIGAPEKKVKVSIRSPYLLPEVAIIDPDLSVSMPAEITAYSGMDALTQLIEPFVSNHANPLTDALCLQGIKYAAESLVNVYKDGEDVISREKMSLASLFSGFALANAKLGAVHGFAGVIGGMFSAPHGAVCARLLAPVLEVNINSLSAKKGESPYLKRFDKIAQILTGKKDSYAQDMIGFVRRLSEQLEIPPLAEHGISEEDFPEIIVKAAGSSSMKGNPVDLNPDELYSIMEMAL
jgi:alcohol dehydrogenase class IV